MKKSTLFTTLALVVIVALALSTATFAWYSTANESVGIQTITLTAKSADPGLLISADGRDWSQQEITFTSEDSSTPMKPAIESNAIKGFYTGKVLHDAKIEFSTATVYSQTFQLKCVNKGTGDFNVTVTNNTPAGDNSTFLKYAICTGDAGNYTIVHTAGFNYLTTSTPGTIENATAESAITATQATVGSLTASEAGSAYTLLVWFEGTDMDHEDAGKAANISFTFTLAA